MVVASGVAPGEGDTDGGMSVSGNNHLEELDIILLVCMHSCSVITY